MGTFVLPAVSFQLRSNADSLVLSEGLVEDRWGTTDWTFLGRTIVAFMDHRDWQQPLKAVRITLTPS